MNNLEPAVLNQVHQGNQEAFTQLVETYQRPVYNLCYRMLGDPDEAEDASQETFLRVYKNIKHYDADRPFSTWLLSIAAHLCIDQLRKRRMVVHLDGHDAHTLSPPDGSPGPEAAFYLKEDQASCAGLIKDPQPTRPGCSNYVLLVRFFLRRDCQKPFTHTQCSEKQAPPRQTDLWHNPGQTRRETFSCQKGIHMDHQPFRNWLLSEEQLSAEQNQSLQEHLASCESCSQFKSSWKELDLFIPKFSSQVAPECGFHTAVAVSPG